MIGARSWILAAVLLASGCAAAGNLVRYDVGRATRFDILDKVERTLTREGYTVQERRDTGSTIQLATSWTTRAPFDDEPDAIDCRTKLTVDARSEGHDMYSVVLRAENLALDQSGEWKPTPASAMLQAHVKELANQLALEVDSGVRTR
jgi:hypothetical protein